MGVGGAVGAIPGTTGPSETPRGAGAVGAGAVAAGAAAGGVGAAAGGVGAAAGGVGAAAGGVGAGALEAGALGAGALGAGALGAGAAAGGAGSGGFGVAPSSFGALGAGCALAFVMARTAPRVIPEVTRKRRSIAILWHRPRHEVKRPALFTLRGRSLRVAEHALIVPVPRFILRRVGIVRGDALV